MSKMGRPKSDNPKNKKVSTRLSEESFVKVKHFVKRKVDIRMNIKIPLEIGRQFTL